MDEPFASRDGVLCAEDVPLPELALRLGTPLWVYSHAALVGRLRALQAAFAGCQPLIAYSVKANPNLAVVAALAREGAGADVVSGGELARALRAGVPPGRVVFSGVGKSEDELRAGVAAGIRAFNVEVDDELDALSRLAVELGREAGVSLRVNPDVAAGGHRYVQTGTRVNKFGIPLDRAAALYRRAAGLPGLRLRGLDCHIGSQITRLEPFALALERVVGLVRALRAEGLPVEELDVGGGLGVRYQDEQPPSFADYAAVVREAVAGLDLGLVLEPGRALVAPAGLLLTRVLYRKETAGKRFVIVDAAMNDLARPALYGAYHPLRAVRAGGGTVVADVVGPICETGDFLALDREVPDAAPGELLAVLAAGAYGRSMSSNYNTRPRAAEVLVRGGEVHLVQERETVEDLLRHERIPPFLAHPTRDPCPTARRPGIGDPGS